MSQTIYLYLSFITAISSTFLIISDTFWIYFQLYLLLIYLFSKSKIWGMFLVTDNRYMIWFSSRSFLRCFSSASHWAFISQFHSPVLEDRCRFIKALSSLSSYMYLGCYSQTENCQRTHFELTPRKIRLLFFSHFSKNAKTYIQSSHFQHMRKQIVEVRGVMGRFCKLNVHFYM